MSASRQIRALTTSARALSFRTTSAPIRTGFAQVSRAAVVPSYSRSFSASVVKSKGGATDVTLAQKLAEEVTYEKNVTAEEGTPEWLTAFQQEGVWKIETADGSDEVVLHRTFGNEEIRLMFTTADIDTSAEPGMLEGEDEEGNPIEDTEEPSYPIRTAITITKPNGAPGALTIDAICQDGLFTLENIAFYKDTKLGTELSADADWKRRGLYMGPQFDHLDVNVQDQFEAFLRERSISEGLALFIPEYAEYKEQLEYVRWLENVKNFIEA